uniref:Uncharacterized protein n=1 Tax=Chlamydomonas euryale TaxID=1486919 RepID=A0A7R9YQX2_9CHLO|mmetsp:Transcript_1055/g.2884  ORF Transcript_1055/g.2884 Transcript_1055/m.2884 type:complete len:198 (+) Transcript_1055:92-685(+)
MEKVNLHDRAGTGRVVPPDALPPPDATLLKLQQEMARHMRKLLSAADGLGTAADTPEARRKLEALNAKVAATADAIRARCAAMGEPVTVQADPMHLHGCHKQHVVGTFDLPAALPAKAAPRHTVTKLVDDDDVEHGTEPLLQPADATTRCAAGTRNAAKVAAAHGSKAGDTTPRYEAGHAAQAARKPVFKPTTYILA